jgi:hypothetical protein
MEAAARHLRLHLYHSAEFKARVAMASLSGEKTLTGSIRR